MIEEQSIEARLNRLMVISRRYHDQLWGEIDQDDPNYALIIEVDKEIDYLKLWRN